MSCKTMTAHHLRHAYESELFAHRHDRDPIFRRSLEGADKRGRNLLSLRRCFALFRKPLSPGDVVESFAGVRPVYDDGAESASAATRDYVFDLEAPSDVRRSFGFRWQAHHLPALAEDAMEKLSPYLKPPREKAWTASAPLPAATWKAVISTGFCGAPRQISLARRAAAARLARLWHAGGEDSWQCPKRWPILGAFRRGALPSRDRLSDRSGIRAHRRDILWRRSKLRLHLSRDQIAAVSAYVDARTRRTRPQCLAKPNC